jgi:N-acetyl-gamma-glutamyl-phosphate reductase
VTKKINIAIIGGAGYSGQELFRYLTLHPVFELSTISSDAHQGKELKDLFPGLYGRYRLCKSSESQNNLATLAFVTHEEAIKKGAELFFLATPNDASIQLVPRILETGAKVVDLSGSFRLANAEIFEKYYKLKHPGSSWINQRVYGLTECNRKEIRGASFVSNPGCYATGALLGLIAFEKFFSKLKGPIMVDAKSGASGAGGRVTSPGLGFVDVNENLKAYKVLCHQHEPEIREHLRTITGFEQNLYFVPHLIPMTRGILSTIWLHFSEPVAFADLRKVLTGAFQDEPFVQVLQEGEQPLTSQVAYSNQCHIQIEVSPDNLTAVVTTAIDNLGKGAAGQAIQNANLMCGLDETIGLA